MSETLSIGSLFSGIGGLDLGLERTGHFRTAWFCERDPYCQRVLAEQWPGVPIYDDATALPDDLEAPDVITAGFPCQPVSHAGRRLAQDDERWLWPHVGRLVRILQPRLVVMENVPGLLTAGFGDVISDLAACGYDAEWDCVPASALGATHRRDRVFIVAHSTGIGQPGPRARWSAVHQPSRGTWPTTDALDALAGGAMPVVCGEHDGLSDGMDRLRALGNAVVPQVAEHVGRGIVSAFGLDR